MRFRRIGRHAPAFERLMRNVIPEPNSGCWLFWGGLQSKGYAQVSDRGAGGSGGALLGHRLVYETLVGPIPEGLDLLHTCDTTQCVNPDHLRPGTNADNMRDAWRKGRAAFQRDPSRRRRHPEHEAKWGAR